MPPHSEIRNHFDKGEYSVDGHRIHVVVSTNPNVSFHVCQETECLALHVEQGLVFELNNRLKHNVVNGGDVQRVHLVVDVAEGPKERTEMRPGQVCKYVGRNIVC
jgi:hypothetical protein